MYMYKTSFVQKLALQMKALEKDYETLKSKLDAAKAR